MRYQFLIQGVGPSDAVVDLPELSVTRYPTGGTALFGPARDEADVWTLLARTSELGLSVVNVHPLPD